MQLVYLSENLAVQLVYRSKGGENPKIKPRKEIAIETQTGKERQQAEGKQ